MKHSPRALLALSLVAAVLPLAGQASAATSSSSLTGAGTLSTPLMPELHGKKVPELFGSPVVGDVDGDGEPDIVAGYQDGHLYAWHQDGTLFLNIKTGGQIRTTPSLQDLNGNGVVDILTAGSDGSVSAWDGKGHRIFHVTTPAKFGLIAIFSAPTAGDLDGDGKKEVVATSWDHYLWAWDLAGHVKRGFPVYLEDTSWSSPAIADLNGDGHRDIVFGYDCVGVKGQTCTTKYHRDGGLVGAIDYQGHYLRGFPVFVPGQAIWSTPAVADLNGDGKLDVVVGTGLYSAYPAGNQVWAWDSAGHKLAGFPVATRGRVMGAPAVGDINGDGRPDVTAMDERSWVWAWNGTGHLLPGFPVCGANAGTCNQYSLAHASDVLADVTGDGKVDVIAAGQTYLHVWDGSGHLEGSYKLPAGTTSVAGAPTVATLGDRAEILLSSTKPQSGGNTSGTVVRATFGQALGPAPWPEFRQNPRGTGHLDDLVAPSAPTITATPGKTSTLFDLRATDVGSGVAAFEIYYRDNGGALQHWVAWGGPTAHDGATAIYRRTLATRPGHSYRIQVHVRDHDPNVGPWSAQTVVTPTS